MNVFCRLIFEDFLWNNVDVDALTAELLHLGFGKDDIESTLKDVRYRLKWTVGSECFVYSRSIKQWIGGRIKSVSVDGVLDVEWLTVKYGLKKKEIQRFSEFIKPKEFGDEYRFNTELVGLITKRLKGRDHNHSELKIEFGAYCSTMF